MMSVHYMNLDCSRRVVRDVVFVVDTSVRPSDFQLVREFIQNITIALKVNSPETLIGLITFDSSARLEFNISNHTDLPTLLSDINPGLPHHYRDVYYSTNSAVTAISYLLAGSVEGGFLQLRNDTSKVAIVIDYGYSDTSSSLLQSVVNSLHATNIFDVYAVGISFYSNNDIWLIASNPSFRFYTSSFARHTAQQLNEDVIEHLCSSKLLLRCIIIIE